MLRRREVKVADALKNRSKKRGGDGRRTLLQQRVDSMTHYAAPEAPSTLSAKTLESLPLEMFQRIASLLPALSAISLSATCRDAQERLSYECGNYVFYQALPDALLMTEERCQPGQGDMANVVLVGHTTPEPRSTGHRSTLSSGCSTPTTPFPSSRFAERPYDSAYAPASGSTVSDISVSDQVSAVTRKRVLALGGPYNGAVDYRKEILGYAREKKLFCFHCFASLPNTISRGQVTWANKKWCETCSNSQDYFLDASWPARHRLDPELRFKINAMAAPNHVNAKLYYAPTVDVILRELRDLNLGDFVVDPGVSMATHSMKRLSITSVEARRLDVRRAVVSAAEKLWDGQDPAPIEIKNMFGEIVSFQTNPTLPCADQWENFRDRFCPTVKVKQMLFSDSKLSDKPTSAGVQKGFKWLDDPTDTLRQKSHFGRVTDQWLTATALGMLYRLVDFTNPLYCEPGWGGSCTAWIQAATHWHMSRFDAELASGSVIAMQHVSPAMRMTNHGMHRGIANLRERLGLSRSPADQQQLAETNAAVSRSYFPEEARSLPSFQHDENATEASVNKYFHHIVARVCSRCPISSYLFHFFGLECMLEHMRTYHSRQSWTSDDFHCLA